MAEPLTPSDPMQQASTQQASTPPSLASKEPTSSLAVASLVLGIIAIILAFIPIINNLAFILAIIGLALGIAGIIVTGKHKHKVGRGLALTGVILALLSGAITLGMQQIFSTALDEAMQTSSSSATTKSNAAQVAQDNAQSSARKDVTKPSSTADIDNGNYTVKIVSAVKSSADYEGKPTVLVTYTVTNNMKKNSNMFDINTTVFQNGKSLEPAMYIDIPQGYDPESSLTTLQPGATKTVTEGYVLADEKNPVTVEITGTMDISGSPVTAQKKFPLT